MRMCPSPALLSPAGLACIPPGCYCQICITHHLASLLAALTCMLATLAGKFCDGQLRLDCAYIYTAIVNNGAQIWALYCLILFYKVSTSV